MIISKAEYFVNKNTDQFSLFMMAQPSEGVRSILVVGLRHFVKNVSHRSSGVAC